MPASTIQVAIFGHEYSIKGSAPSDYINQLADYVDGKMREISDNTSIVSSSKVAILAALNIADELFQSQRDKKQNKDELQDRIENLVKIMDQALSSMEK